MYIRLIFLNPPILVAKEFSPISFSSLFFLIGIILILSAKGAARNQQPIATDSTSELMKKTAIYGLKQIASRCDGGARFWTNEELENYIRFKFPQLSQPEFDPIYGNIRIKLAEERKASSFRDYKETRAREGDNVEEIYADVSPEEIVYFSQERVISVSCRFKQIGSFLWRHGDSLIVGNVLATTMVVFKNKVVQYYTEPEVNSKFVT